MEIQAHKANHQAFISVFEFVKPEEVSFDFEWTGGKIVPQESIGILCV